MKQFDPIEFDVATCRRELDEFGGLLRAKPSLTERGDILPFFRAHRQLSALLGSRNLDIVSVDRIAFEYDLFGDFVCDLVVGDFARRAYCFIEFEEGKPDSIFVQKRGKHTPEWSPRFDRGYSQLIDWYWKLDKMREQHIEFTERFGGSPIHYSALLVVGRGLEFGARERDRLEWRRGRVVVDSRHVDCITFDQLHGTLTDWLDRYHRPARDEPSAG